MHTYEYTEVVASGFSLMVLFVMRLTLGALIEGQPRNYIPEGYHPSQW